MSFTKAIRAGRAFVELFADDSKLVRGLRRAEKRMKDFGGRIRNMGLKIAGLGTAMLMPMLGATKAFGSMGDQAGKMAKRTGMSVEALSELRFVASQTGTSIEDLETGLRRMQRVIYDAGRGLSTANDALADLGLEYRDLDGLSPEAQFKLLADRISQIEDPTKKAAATMTLFGRSATKLLPMFASGAKGIEILQAEARRLGLTMSTEDVQAAEEFTDSLDKLWKVIKIGIFNVGAALSPTLEMVAERLTQAAVVVSDWIKQNRQLIVNLLEVAAIVVAAGVALATLGTIIIGLSATLGVLISILTTVVAGLQVLGAVFAFLVSPIGMVIAAVAAMAGYLVYATGASGEALSWLGDRFNALKDDALTSYQSIADALASGDIAMAAKILWLTLKMEWTRGINALEKAWLNFRNFFIKIGYDAWGGLLATVGIVWHALEVGWIESVSFLGRAWTKFTSLFSRTWENMKAIAKKAWTWIKSWFDGSTEESRKATYAEINAQRDAAIAKIDDKEKQDMARREAKREREREEAARQRDKKLAVIGQENLERHAKLEAEYKDRMAENEADIESARDKWKQSIEESRRKREAEDDARRKGLEGPDALEGPEDIIERANRALAGMGDIDDLLAEQAERIDVGGTFVAANVLGLQAGGATDRLTDGINKIERNTRPLRDAEELGFT